jgi:hypothetical protein
MYVCEWLNEDNKAAVILVYDVLIMCQLNVCVVVIYC